MTILGRYIFRQAFGAVVLILASLTIVIWIAVALRQLEFTASQGQSTALFFTLTTLALPALISFIAPIALLIASTHTLNRLNSDSELIVTTAGGASTWRLATPLLFLALLISLAVAWVNHFGAPMANRALRDIALQARTDLISQVLQPGRFTTPEPKLTVHIRHKNPADGMLLGLLVNDSRNDTQAASYLAESGYIVKQGNAAYLLMQKGHILRRPPDGGAADVITFERYAVDLNRFEQKADAAAALRPREYTTPEMLALDRKEPAYVAQAGRYRSELHDRVATSLYAFAYVLIALAFVGQAQTTRQNRTQALVMAISLGFAVRIAGISAANQAVVKASAIPLMYAIPIVTACLGLFMIARNLRPRRPWRVVLAQRSAKAA